MKRFVDQRKRAILSLHRGEVYLGTTDSSQPHSLQRSLVSSRRGASRLLDLSEDGNLLSRCESNGQRPLQRERVSARLHGWKDAGTEGSIPRSADATTAGSNPSNCPDGIRVGACNTCGRWSVRIESDAVGNAHQAWIAFRQDWAARLEGDPQEEAVDHRYFHVL